VDADTTFDRDALSRMIEPFYDPEVGIVAGNLKVRNRDFSVLTRMQALEYMQSITMWKTWLKLLGWNMQASGAFGAFRRHVLESVAAWDPELAEDADLSLKIKKAGWKVEFAPRAIAMTSVPEDFRQLVVQRHRWDRGLLRTYYRKHSGLMRFWRFDWSNAAEMALEFIFSIFLTFLYFVWFTYMFVFHTLLLPFVIVITYVVYVAASFLILGIGTAFSERRSIEWRLLFYVPFFPIYKAWFRWVRLYSLTLEVFRINYEQSYLPESAWRNARRW
jgi:cellulose synthase/poly-beta-1,6-N-acetylglucosamine synthase-like glycosyltransferase